MRVVIIWRENSEYGRDVADWLHEFKRRTGKEHIPDALRAAHRVERPERTGPPFGGIYAIPQKWYT